MSKIGIQAAPFSKEIHAGVLNKAGRQFTASGPQNVTDMALHAVADFTLVHFDGKAQFTFKGFTMTVEVEKNTDV